MYCPQCGRELNLDSGDVWFCRYCNFLLTDTKEALQGYSKQKRTGFSIVTWSYALLLIVTLLLHGGYLPNRGGMGLLGSSHTHRRECQSVCVSSRQRNEAAIIFETRRG